MKQKTNKKFNPIFSKGRTKETKSWDTIVKILCFVFLILITIGILIYRKTLIEPYILWRLSFIGAAIGVIVCFILFSDYQQLFSGLLFSGVIGAGLLYFTPLILNRVFVSEKINTETFEIIRTGNMGSGRSGRCKSPYAEIYFGPLKKELVFSCSFEDTIGNYKKVRLEYSDGLFGFPVIRRQILIE